MESYNLYLKARHLFDQQTEESMALAVEYYRQALAIDPNYAEGWAALAEAQAVRANQGFADYSATPDEAVAAARRAIQLNPAMSKAYFALGLVQFSRNWDWSAAEASLKKAVELDASESKALTLAGALAQKFGRDAEGIELCRQAVLRNPIGAYERLNLGFALARAGFVDEALKEARSALELSPGIAQGWYVVGWIHLLKKQPELALTAIQKESSEAWRLSGLPLAMHDLGQHAPSERVLGEAKAKYSQTMPYQIAQVHAYRGEIDQAFSSESGPTRKRGTCAANSFPHGVQSVDVTDAAPGDLNIDHVVASAGKLQHAVSDLRHAL